MNQKLRKITIENEDVLKANEEIHKFEITKCCPAYQAFKRNGLRDFYVGGGIISNKQKLLFDFTNTSFAQISMSTRFDWDNIVGTSVEIPEEIFT